MKKLLFLTLTLVSLIGYSQHDLLIDEDFDSLTFERLERDTLTFKTVVNDTVTSYESPIDPQRPTITESNTLVSKGRLQFENGYDVDLTNNTNSMGTFIRYGLANNLELRMATNFVDSGINVGAKFRLFDIDKLNLGTAFIVDYNTVGGSFYKGAITIGITETIYTTYNLCYQNNSDIYHVALLGYSKNKCGAFVEYTDAGNTNRIHGGTTYRASNSLQIDLNGGYFTDLKTTYVGAGLSFFVL
jgi:hypothetical protein